MKIYTYYNECPTPHLKPDHQKDLINLWKDNWSRNGFTPIVLHQQHAESHEFFETFDSELKNLHKIITGKELKTYGMSCYHRWLAYATRTEEHFYVSDYDVLNVNLKHSKIKPGVHFYDGYCPSFASGAPHEFLSLCKSIIEVSHARIDYLKHNTDHYHDQEVFFYNFCPKHNKNCEQLQKKHNLTFIKRPEVSPFYDPVLNKFFRPHNGSINYVKNNYDVTVAHIAHYNSGIVRDKYPQFNDINNTRLHIMKTLNRLYNTE